MGQIITLAILYAAKKGDTALIPILLKYYSSGLNEQDAEGWTPLLWAAKKGYVDTVKLLIDKGANIDFANRTALLP